MSPELIFPMKGSIKTVEGYSKTVAMSTPYTNMEAPPKLNLGFMKIPLGGPMVRARICAARGQQSHSACLQCFFAAFPHPRRLPNLFCGRTTLYWSPV